MWRQANAVLLYCSPIILQSYYIDLACGGKPMQGVLFSLCIIYGGMGGTGGKGEHGGVWASVRVVRMQSIRGESIRGGYMRL